MWYKYNEDTQEWYEGGEVHLPSGTVLKDDHSMTEDGWFWADEKPYNEENSDFSVN